MSRNRRFRRRTSIVSLATAYNDQSTELVIPESFDGMEYAQLTELNATASAQFDALYAEYADTMTDEQIATLSALTSGIEALSAEIADRDTQAADRAAAGAELASRVQALRANTDGDEAPADEAPAEDEEGEAPAEEPATDDESAAQTVVASGAARREVRIPLSSVGRPVVTPPAATRPDMSSVVLSSGEGTGYAVGTGMDWDAVGRAVDRKLSGHNSGQYASAARTGLALKEQHSIISIRREFASDLTINDNGREHVDAVLARAVDQSRLPGGGLIAAGGWCAPSETMYDLLEMETLSGLLSLPEVGISRGGVQFTTGPSFADLFSTITGFNFTEQEDIDGKYQPGVEGNVVGPKPCYHIECPEFVEVRLDATGICLTAGLLQQRGYPEVIARTVRGALVAHAHRVNALLIQKLVAGSTSVTFTAQAGAAAPILDATELQVQHYRATHRLDENHVLEAVFPMWARGLFRADLSRRQGVDMLSVTNGQIDGWLRERGVNPQFVYNWQDIASTTAGSFTAWPNELKFLLYSAGTWVRGSTDILTVDTMYDSTLLSQNDYTALWTEEGWLVMKRGFDSRVITITVSADGATHQGIDIAHGGAAIEAPGSTAVAPLHTLEATGA